MNLNRRTFLKTTTAVGGGFMIGSYLALDGTGHASHKSRQA